MMNHDLPAESLTWRLHLPEGAREGSPLLVLLHGRGADESDLLGLASLLPDDVVLITPRGTFPGLPWGYGPGRAWYRYVAEDRVEPETLEQSLGRIDDLMARVAGELPLSTGPRILGGFSQGGTTSLAWALTRPGGVAGVLNLSGFLVDSPLVPLHAVDPETVPPVFWGHGVQDSSIPFSLAERGRERLRRIGVRLESFDHPAGHTITAEEMHALKGWIREVAGATG
jgi:phospholipase/carboxylesterase